MAGESGAGKSTLARAVGEATGAVVLDKDLIYGPLIEEGVLKLGMGGPSYAVLFALAESILAQGFSVVVDSGAFWTPIIERGQAVSASAGVRYHIVACRCADAEEQERRLTTRTGEVSQPRSRAELLTALSRPGVLLTVSEPHLDVDTTEPLDVCVRQVLEYIRC
jgi:predicted kinase